MSSPARLRSSNLYCLGIDVHKDSSTLAGRSSDAPPIQTDQLRFIKTETFPRTQKGALLILDYAQKHMPQGSTLLVVMESTGPYSLQLALWLKELRPELAVAIVNPARIKHYIQSTGIRNKTDKIDARMIACFGAERQPVGDEPLEPIYRDLRALSQARLRLMDAKQTLENQRSSLCPEDLSRPVFRQISKAYDTQIRSLEKQMDQLEQEMRELVRGNARVTEDIKLLESIVGVGFLTAAAVLGECGDLRRFRTGRQLAAFCGLNPEVRKSGKWEGETHLSKKGSTWARRALYMAAVSAVSGNSEMKEFYQRLVEEEKKVRLVALAAVMRKLLVTMRALVAKGEKYERFHQADKARKAQELRAAKGGNVGSPAVENSGSPAAI